MATATKTNPKLWERIVSKVKSGSKGGLSGQWSARKAQIAVQEYKKAGGGYSSKGASKGETSLNKWTKEEWTTSDKKPAIRKDRNGKSVTTRYLPKKAWDELSPAEKAATNRKKKAASKQGKQFVPNTAKAKKASKKVRGKR